MKDNRVCELYLIFCIFNMFHGKVSIADIFTKELKDITHYDTLQYLLICHFSIWFLFSLLCPECDSFRGVVIIITISHLVNFKICSRQTNIIIFNMSWILVFQHELSSIRPWRQEEGSSRQMSMASESDSIVIKEII